MPENKSGISFSADLATFEGNEFTEDGNKIIVAGKSGRVTRVHEYGPYEVWRLEARPRRGTRKYTPVRYVIAKITRYMGVPHVRSLWEHELGNQWRSELPKVIQKCEAAVDANFAVIEDVLVECCGANREQFTSYGFRYHLRQWFRAPRFVFEWRFQGALGFGGKFYATSDGFRVNCYPEDETPERMAMIARANDEFRKFGPGSRQDV